MSCQRCRLSRGLSSGCAKMGGRRNEQMEPAEMERRPTVSRPAPAYRRDKPWSLIKCEQLLMFP